MPRPYKKGLRSTVYSRSKMDTARGLIKVQELLKLLQDNALGKIELDAIRQRSIEISLRKALPDLSAVEMAVTDATPFALIPAVMDSSEDWQKAFAPANSKPVTEH